MKLNKEVFLGLLVIFLTHGFGESSSQILSNKQIVTLFISITSVLIILILSNSLDKKIFQINQTDTYMINQRPFLYY